MIFHLPSIFLDFMPLPREMLNIWMKMFFRIFSVKMAFSQNPLQNEKEKRQKEKLHIKSECGWRKGEWFNRTDQGQAWGHPKRMPVKEKPLHSWELYKNSGNVNTNKGRGEPEVAGEPQDPNLHLHLFNWAPFPQETEVKSLEKLNWRGQV